MSRTYGFTWFSRWIGMVHGQIWLRIGCPSALYLVRSQIKGHWTNSTKIEKNPDLYGQVRVSPYRLCAHLGTAFVFIVSTLWTALDISVKNKERFETFEIVTIYFKTKIADKASFLLVPQKTLSDNCASSFDIFPCHGFFEAYHTHFLRHLIVKNSL